MLFRVYIVDTGYRWSLLNDQGVIFANSPCYYRTFSEVQYAIDQVCKATLDTYREPVNG